MYSRMQEPNFTPQEKKKLGPIFDKIKKCARVSRKERKLKRIIAMDVLRDLEKSMRASNILFNEIFQEFRYTGSYYDNLRITNANEFDINVVLSLPVRSDCIRLESYTGNFAELCIDFDNYDPIVNLSTDVRRQFHSLLDTDGRVLPGKVLPWMKSVFAKAFNRLGSYQHQLHMSESGPAMTLKIRPNGWLYTIDVDLVAVFRMEQGRWVEDNQCFQADIVQNVKSSRQRMYLVPKTQRGLPEFLWRKHFPEVELQFLKGKRAAKPVIRILKLLRDKSQWYDIASYYLKTLVMIEVAEHVDEPEYWDDKRTPYLVFEMMQKLMNCFKYMTLRHLLYRDVNLLQLTNKARLTDLSYHLNRIYMKCLTDVDRIEGFFIPIGHVVHEMEGPPYTIEDGEEETEDESEDEQKSCTLL